MKLRSYEVMMKLSSTLLFVLYIPYCFPACFSCWQVAFINFVYLILGSLDYINLSSHDLQGHEPFVSYEGLEQLHRFIFVMAITHVSYSCLTMLLAIVKVSGYGSLILENQKNTDIVGP